MALALLTFAVAEVLGYLELGGSGGLFRAEYLVDGRLGDHGAVAQGEEATRLRRGEVQEVRAGTVNLEHAENETFRTEDYQKENTANLECYGNTEL